MLFTIQFRTFCFRIYSTKTYKLKPTELLSLPVVLHGCEAWSLTLGEEHKLTVFEKKVVRGIFGPKRNEIIGGWRK
jgi:hypothetical protein